MASEDQKELVLIVEDDAEMRDYLQHLLRGEGFRTETSSDGLDAVEKITRTPPYAVILDLMLPRYGGLEMLAELRRKAPGVPLIIVTARFADQQSRARIAEHPNVAGFFVKPVNTEELLASLRDLRSWPA
jgi:DNA-binding response OmpR family regulator